jgi:enoyl-CoA hydratase/carnithine racemase
MSSAKAATMLAVEDRGDVRVLRLARPPVNALDRELLSALAGAVRQAPPASARGLVLTGDGARYCGGLDVQALLAADAAGLRALLEAFLDALHALATSPIPVVAAINGHSPAGGAVLALHCDRRVMGPATARIGLNEVAAGLCPGPLIHQVLVRTVGPRHAESLLTRGVMLSATDAAAVGLIDTVVAGDPFDAAMDWLQSVLALPPHAYGPTRTMARADLVALLDHYAVTGRAHTLDRLIGEWTQPATRAALAGLLARR